MMTKRMTIRIAIALVTALLFTACGKEAAPVATESEETSSSALIEEATSESTEEEEHPTATPTPAVTAAPITVAPEEEPEEGTEKETETAEPETLTFIDAWEEWHTVNIDPGVPKHPYNWEYLKNGDDGISYDDGTYRIRKGVDVSEHQGEIDWNSVRDAGYEFAIIRIACRGYGQEGLLFDDAYYRQNIEQAQEAGLDVGVYIFSQAITEDEAREEADYTLSLLEEYLLQLPVVYDPEFIRDDEARTDGVSGEQFTKNTKVFCERVKDAGRDVMIYANMIWESMVFDLKELEGIPVWYADYEPAPQTPYDFCYWQYSNTGTVPGIQGAVDLNIQFIKE